jgi:hypothetical protein
MSQPNQAHMNQTQPNQTAREPMQERYDEYRPRLRGAAALAAQNDPNKPEYACCNNEQRGMNGGCANCGAPCA